jgi:8-hydroxy-5-deazaflavin:NADPH oxidoreductase
MKISILGAGNIGGTLARLLVKTGYDVALANSRGPVTLNHFAEELGEKLIPLTVEEAVAYSELIILAIPWRKIDSLSVFKVPDKIIIDTTNPYREDGTIYDLQRNISSIKAEEHFPGGKVIKAFNTIWYMHLAENGNMNLPLEARRVIPLAGDDAEAKKKVSKLIGEIGFGPLDTGSLKEGSKLQGVEGVLYARELSVKEAVAVIEDLK